MSNRSDRTIKQVRRQQRALKGDFEIAKLSDIKVTTKFYTDRTRYERRYDDYASAR